MHTFNKIALSLGVLILFAFVSSRAYALSTYKVVQGGTGSTSPSGILYGDNGATDNLKTVTIGTGLTLTGSTLTSSGSFPFTPLTNYAINTSATTTALWAKAGLFASSTSQFDQINVGSSTTGTMSTSTFNGNVSVVSGGFSSGAVGVGGYLWHDYKNANPWFGIYDAANVKYYGIAKQLPSPTASDGVSTSVLGGYYYGLGIGGATNSGLNPIFGVLNSSQSANGMGNVAFTVYANNTIQDFYNVIDDGAGRVGIGTTTPFAAFSIGAKSNGTINTSLFNIGSSTASATTSLFNISNTGAITTSLGTGCVTSTSGLLSVGSACGTVTSVSGTTNQITSSGGATPVIALANNVIFPISFNATYGTTTFASSTALTATRLFSTDATTTSLAITNETLSSLLYSGVGGSVLSVATTSETCSTGVSCTAHNVLAGGGAITLATMNAGVLGSVLNSTAPTSQATSTLYGVGTPGTILSFQNGQAQWVSTSSIFSLTTTGSSGAATYSAGVLNIPQYSGGGANSKWATTTSPIDALAISPNGGVNTLVGIGTTTPHFSLQIASSTGPQLALSDTSSTADRWIFRSVGNNFYLASSSALTFASSTLSTANNPFTILGGTTLNTSGNVGLGTSSPFARLSIQADANATYLAIGSSSQTQLTVGATSNAYTSFGIGTTTPWAQFSFNPVASGGSVPAFVIGSSSATSFVVDNGGKVGIATSTPWAALSVQGRVALNGLTSSGSSQTGYICYSTGGELIQDSAVCLVSAKKFKKDIQNLDVGLTDLLTLTPVSYYKKDPIDTADSFKQMGFIADDIPTALQEMLVTRDSKGDVHGFRYDQFTALITKSVQDFYIRFEKVTTDLIVWNRDQDKSIKALEEQNKVLQAEIDQLKKAK